MSAAALLAELPEIGQINGKAISSLTGLAPMTRQSGQRTGRNLIRGGLPRSGTKLNVIVISVIRHNPDLACRYKELP